MGIEVDGFPCVDAGALLEQCLAQGIDTSDFIGKANCFYVPAGEHCGKGWVLLLRQHLDQIDIESLHQISFTDDKNNYIFFGNLVFIRGDAVTPGIKDDPNTVFLCEFADPRWLIHNPYYSFPIDAQYNVRVPSGGDKIYYPYSCLGGSSNIPNEWQDMLDEVWSTFADEIVFPGSVEEIPLTPEEEEEDPSPDPEFTEGSPIFGDPPTLPFDADGTPENFCFYNVSVWMAYNSILSRLAATVVPVDGGFDDWRIVPIGDFESDSGLQTIESLQAFEPLRMYDSDSIQSVIARTPSKINVAFHKMFKHHGSEPVASAADSEAWKQWRASPYYVVEQDVEEEIDPGTGCRGLLWDDLSAIDDPADADTVGEENIINTDDLETRAEERVLDFKVSIATNNSFKIKYSGVINDPGIFPGSLISGFAVYNQGQGYITEIVNSQAPLSVSSSGEWVEMWESINQHLSPPDLSKATFPNDPEVMQWTRANSVSTTSAHIYDADIGIRDTKPGSTLGDFIPIDKCWLFDAGTTITVGSAVQARFMGQIQANSAASGTKSRPIYAIVAGGGSTGTPDQETFVLHGTMCVNGALTIVEKTLNVLTAPTHP